jgi:hypothetical protein
MQTPAEVVDKQDQVVEDRSILCEDHGHNSAAAALLRLKRKRPSSCEANEDGLSSTSENTSKHEHAAYDTRPKRPYLKGGHQRMARVNDLLMSFMDEMLQTEERDREAFYKRLANLEGIQAAGVGRLEIVSWFKRARKKIKQEEVKAAEDAERRSKESMLCRGHLVVPTLRQPVQPPSNSRIAEDNNCLLPPAPPSLSHSRVTARGHSWEIPFASTDDFNTLPLPLSPFEQQIESIDSVQQHDYSSFSIENIGNSLSHSNPSHAQQSARPFSFPEPLDLPSPEPLALANRPQSSSGRLVVPLPPRCDNSATLSRDSGSSLLHVNHSNNTFTGFGRAQTSSFHVPTLVPMPRTTPPPSQPWALSQS